MVALGGIHDGGRNQFSECYLFDLRTDLAELTNRNVDPLLKKVRDKIRQQLIIWMSTTGDRNLPKHET